MYPGTYAATHPERPAAVMAGSGDVLTYRELDERSVRLANALRDVGLRQGDTVALVSDNTFRAYEVYWAALRSGLYVAAVNSHLAGAEAEYVIGDSGAKALVVSGALAGLAGDIAAPGVRLRLAYNGTVPGYDDYDAALAAASPVAPADQPRGADLLYSSGTTGRPKGIRVELPDAQVTDSPGSLVPLLQAMYGFGFDTVYLSPGPVYHAAPLRFAASVQALGGTVVMMERFDAEGALAAIERYQVTASQWVPTMFVRMLKLPAAVRERYDLGSHRVAVHAAASCPVDVKRAMIDWWGPILYEYYSSTEGLGMTAIDSAAWLDRPGSVGRPVLGTVRICDDTGNVLPAGRIGTVYFERDEEVFSYLNDPEQTTRSRHPEHPLWSTVGDVGYVDDGGYLFLTDRAAFTIISGGVNIYPQEVENALALHPAVLDVAVIGVPDAERGESVLAVVQPAAGVTPGPELAAALREHVRGRIAHYKAPQRVEFVDELPRTPTGKLVKGALRQRYGGPTGGAASA
ncbi:MAG TPA: acyl-CoA synthetase [Pseudonocardiaceae bacterium]|nr:acyl-CoA synthetase [Pseudonocardiaceae bacterium]